VWSDNETDRDFLNFSFVADLAAEIILQADGKALSIGVSGGWGVGKSSLVKLIEASLRRDGGKDFLFIKFDAWLYQGLDDAKAALLDVIAQELAKRAKSDAKISDKIHDFAKRIDYLRVGRIGVDVASSLLLGVPIGSLVKGIADTASALTDGTITASDVEQTEKVAEQTGAELKGMVRGKKAAESPPRAIQALRAGFEEILNDLKVTLVVFVDDLDRCLPPTAISTLEAIRLFLFMDRTAFVVAADDKMIREAVRVHFKDANLDDDLVTSYFDKLIQIPIKVPALGVNEVKAYLMLLFVERSTIDKSLRDQVRVTVCGLLGKSWQGSEISPTAVQSMIAGCPPELAKELELCDRLARLMTISRRINGNPRLIKRFLNTLSIRKALARRQNIDVDEAVLAKVLLMERCASQNVFIDFIEMINATANGIPAHLAAAEKAAREGDQLPKELPASWRAEEDFILEWLSLDPAIGGHDLRGALHVGREGVPVVSYRDRLSSDASTAFRALAALRVDPAPALLAQVGALSPDDRDAVMGRLIGAAAIEISWGVPNILRALIAVADQDTQQARRLATFFKSVPGRSLTASIVPRLAGKSWGPEILDAWKANKDVDDRVKRAIDGLRKG
jgi:predicted KAP-like P-loop ATPase